jgi:hypothetical protein
MPGKRFSTKCHAAAVRCQFKRCQGRIQMQPRSSVDLLCSGRIEPNPLALVIAQNMQQSMMLQIIGRLQ